MTMKPLATVKPHATVKLLATMKPRATLRQRATLKMYATVIVTALCAATTGGAEVIRIPIGQQAAEKQVLETPRRGATKAQVRARFGEPRHETAAVGNPPISSWEYENYRVYFEGDRVLHSVLKGTATPVPAGR